MDLNLAHWAHSDFGHIWTLGTLGTFKFRPHWDFGDIGHIGHIHQDIGHIQILATLGLWAHWGDS